jgi:hypothetical protein
VTSDVSSCYGEEKEKRKRKIARFINLVFTMLAKKKNREM